MLQQQQLGINKQTPCRQSAVIKSTSSCRSAEVKCSLSASQVGLHSLSECLLCLDYEMLLLPMVYAILACVPFSVMVVGPGADPLLSL